MSQRPLPPELCGLWRRSSLETPGAPADVTTLVFWLQTPSLYVDIRVPAERAVPSDRSALADCSDAELGLLATQAGFAGSTSLDGDVCRWQRDIDYQPPTGVPDEGRLSFAGERIVEDGIHVPYREIWERVAESTGDWLAQRESTRSGPTAGSTTYLVAGGDWFLYARSRAGEPLAPAVSLADLVAEQRLGRAALLGILDFEISLGRRRGGDVPWQVVLSTLPFREGKPLAPAVPLATAQAR